MSTGKAALIDMGTNTFHLLLVEINEVGFKTLYKEKKSQSNSVKEESAKTNLLLKHKKKSLSHTETF